MECIHNCERCFYLTNGNLDEGGWVGFGGGSPGGEVRPVRVPLHPKQVPLGTELPL